MEITEQTANYHCRHPDLVEGSLERCLNCKKTFKIVALILKKMGKGGCIYIMTNYQRSTLYIGVTSGLRNRILEHKEKKYPNSFTAKYELGICLYFESFSSIEEAIDREKQLKKWSRTKKEKLISSLNKEWKDLSAEILEW